MIMAALYTRLPFQLAGLEWSDVVSRMPHDDNSLFGLELAFLLDILAQIPALYHERDGILSTQIAITNAENTDQSLVNRSLLLLDNICSKITHWRLSHPNSEFPSFPCSIFPQPSHTFVRSSRISQPSTPQMYSLSIIAF